jgi:hypothetical protein
MNEEVVIPFSSNPETIRPVTQVRSTLLTSSLRSVRDRNLFEKYLSILPRQHHDAILAAVAGTWLPIAVAEAHYQTCDALGFSVQEQVQIGLEVAQRIQGTFLGTMVKLAKGGGATPWHALEHYQKLWDRLMAGGGGVQLARLGPKEGKIRIVGLSLSRIPYFRVAFRGINQGSVELFSRKAYVSDIPQLCTPLTLGYRISWV